ncbi:MAG: transglutaminase domain-containing protein [Chthonomonadales bacterium]|nr:transglutaminase domain-containing protein [Chthonomonadales bacterium]
MRPPTRPVLWRLGIPIALIVSGIGHARAQDRQTSWYGMYMNGRKIGSMSLTTEPVTEGGVTRVRLTTVSSVSLTMMGTTIRQDTTAISVCDTALRPLRQEYTIESGGSTMRLKATFGANAVTCLVEAGGSPSKKTVPIPKGAVLTADSSFMGVGSAPKIGTRATLYYLNPLTVAIEKAAVKVDAVGKATLGAETYDAYRVTASTPQGAVVSWQTESGELLWARLPLGMAMYRLTETAAKFPGTPEPSTSESLVRDSEVSEDFAAATSIVPDRPIPNPRQARKLTLEIGGIPDDYQPISDRWQKVRKAAVSQVGDGKAERVFIFEVATAGRPRTRPKSSSLPADVARYAKAAPYLDQDRPGIRDLAKRLRDATGNPAMTASRIRAWIHKNMTPDFGIGVPRSALDVLKRKRGVCRDYATLFAALARSAGIPTRLAGGIVYGEGRFYYHAWVECWLGQWIPYDATLPTDFVDATHVKFSQGDPTDMMEVARVIGKLSIRVIEAEP